MKARDKEAVVSDIPAPAYPLVFVLILMGLDILFGIIGSFRAKNVNSGKMDLGGFHKAGSIGVIILAAVYEVFAPHINLSSLLSGIGIQLPEFPAYDIACAYVAFTEIVSIMENLVKINPDLARLPFFSALKQASQSSSKEIVVVDETLPAGVEATSCESKRDPSALEAGEKSA